MLLSDFIKKCVPHIPIDYDPGQIAYKDAVSESVERFLGQLKTCQPDAGSKLSKLKSRVQFIRNMHSQLQAALSYYAAGQHGNAMDQLSSAMRAPGEAVWKNLVTLPLGPDQHNIEPLYRARHDSTATLAHEGMFHIPFELRCRVRTQRFSYPGLPCLYLGSSVAVCWSELGCPRLDELSVSRFEIAPGQKIHLLNFGYHPKEFDLLAEAETAGDFVVDYLTFWPFIAACSVVSRTKDSIPSGYAGFVVEYVVPQMLLEYVRAHEDIDGIRHLSTKLARGTSASLMRNIVLPVQSYDLNEGHCERLKTKLILTEPLSLAHPLFPREPGPGRNSDKQLGGLWA